MWEENMLRGDWVGTSRADIQVDGRWARVRLRSAIWYLSPALDLVKGTKWPIFCLVCYEAGGTGWVLVELTSELTDDGTSFTRESGCRSLQNKLESVVS